MLGVRITLGRVIDPDRIQHLDTTQPTPVPDERPRRFFIIDPELSDQQILEFILALPGPEDSRSTSPE